MKRKNSYDYYSMFVKMADYSCEASEMLREIVKNFNVKELSQEMVNMHKIEHDADVEKHTMMQNLAKEFLPPIEREDIIELAQQLDDVIDAIEDVLLRLYMYNVKNIRQETIDFMDIVVECCKEMKSMMEEFPSFRKSTRIHDYIVKINNMEEEGDKLYTEAMRSLYVESRNPMEIISWTQLFQCLEDCCDACEDVADIVESIIMKNI
ncbi:DUF47 domain-containing protein [Xylanivirga thermophila]|jgi:predicted phosphate transport protein (TIGR00153 family)|uniref:DUF47 domain-containing protein n=1 Tax=Xylanivirga thermophila TaxID=2496273 RepID=UPI00101CA889|nr:DUF47 family protein [Xylanivirga thermophila]